MKRITLIASLFFAGIVISQAQTKCDTLKWKTIQTFYGKWNGVSFYDMGHLGGAVINIDTLSVFYPSIDVVNISKDTFYGNTRFLTYTEVNIFTDTGVVSTARGNIGMPFVWDRFPNDTVRPVVLIGFDLPDIINQVKTGTGIDFEQISYWQLIIGINYTDKDGYYLDSVFYAGADTSTFYVVRTPVNIVETDYIASPRQIFPNPARSQFTVTNTQNASLHLYNMVGQEVLHTQSTDENTIINVSTLPQGLYVLKVVKDGAVKMYKVVVSG